MKGASPKGRSKGFFVLSSLFQIQYYIRICHICFFIYKFDLHYALCVCGGMAVMKEGLDRQYREMKGGRPTGS